MLRLTISRLAYNSGYKVELARPLTYPVFHTIEERAPLLYIRWKWNVITRSSRKLGQVSHQAPYPDQWIVSQGLKAKLQPPEAPASWVSYSQPEKWLESSVLLSWSRWPPDFFFLRQFEDTGLMSFKPSMRVILSAKSIHPKYINSTKYDKTILGIISPTNNTNRCK